MKFLLTLVVLALLGFGLSKTPDSVNIYEEEEYFFVIARREPTIEERIVSSFTPFGRNVPTNMLKISRCESGFNPADRKSWGYSLNNKNVADSLVTGYTSWGLFMINAPKFEGWNEASINIARAVLKYESQGYGAWYNCATGLGII